MSDSRYTITDVGRAMLSRYRVIPECPRCVRKLERGQAMAQTFVGSPDFAGDPSPVTLSPGGPGALIECMKCPQCGYSETCG